jgi:hypothetical protein
MWERKRVVPIVVVHLIECLSHCHHHLTHSLSLLNWLKLTLFDFLFVSLALKIQNNFQQPWSTLSCSHSSCEGRRFFLVDFVFVVRELSRFLHLLYYLLCDDFSWKIKLFPSVPFSVRILADSFSIFFNLQFIYRSHSNEIEIKMNFLRIFYFLISFAFSLNLNSTAKEKKKKH